MWYRSPKLLRLVLIFFLAGLGLGVSVSAQTALQAVLFLAALIISSVFVFKTKTIFLICLLALGLGMLRASFAHNPELGPGDYEASVLADTVVSNYGSITEVSIEGQTIKIGAQRYPEFKAGQKVKVTIKKVYPHGRFASGFLEALAEPADFSIRGSLFGVRRAFQESLSRVLPEPQASFVSASVVGGASALPQDLKDNFAATGISHILSASGYNFSLLLMFVGVILRRVPFRHKNLLFLLIIPSFAIIAGATAAVIRAALMAGLTSFALLNGRLSTAKSSILWAAFLILIFDPGLLVFDLGFQLSFLATLGLAFISPLFEKFSDTDFTASFKSIVLGLLFASLAAQLATAPLIAYYFGTISLVSLMVNVLVVGFVPIIMITGILASLVSLLSLSLAQIVAWPAFALSTYIFKVAEFFSRFSWSQIEATPSLAVLGLSYFLLFGLVFYFRRKFFVHRHLKPA